MKDGAKISVKCVVEKAMSITVNIRSVSKQIIIELVRAWVISGNIRFVTGLVQ